MTTIFSPIKPVNTHSPTFITDEEPLEAYQLGMTARSPHPGPKSTWSLARLAEKIFKPNQNPLDDCSLSTKSRDVQVCFYFSDDHTPGIDGTEVTCITTPTSVRSLGTNVPNRSFDIGFVILILIVDLIEHCT
ncbi:hypothetical protein ElyMa_001603300 [Elysia marginata]|uniref:MAM domain-containing protein n=1 Tax=Elysia marginata TaxID=1093978 RepID=A0AAV4JID1_9GAST|nr:hypothetical protein ElyMa_001603300 [Elysia marginata]